MLFDALDSKAAPTLHNSELLVLHVSSPWMPGGKVQTETLKGALTKLKAKPRGTSWSILPLNVPSSLPDSFPYTVLPPKVKYKLVDVSPPRRNCQRLHCPEQSWLKGEGVLEPASCPCSQTCRSQQPHRLGSQGTSASPWPQSAHLGCWTYSLLKLPPGTVILLFLRRVE